VGVDDWAWRKGYGRYGTILVDLKRRKVADLLPECSAVALEQLGSRVIWSHSRKLRVVASNPISGKLEQRLVEIDFLGFLQSIDRIIEIGRIRARSRVSYMAAWVST
jgi:hypothetical protein